MPDLIEILKTSVQRGASDVFILPQEPPSARVAGVPSRLEGLEPLSPEESQRMVYSLLTDEQKARFEQDWELDCSIFLPGVARFRLNVFRQSRGVAMVLRVIAGRIPTPQELGLMPSIVKLTELPRGLILVTGPTGSGKSTTLACLIEHINQAQKKHIVTIEEPIESVFQGSSSFINQREVGLHTRSFAQALKHVLRQNPDIILIGEMRDLETIQLAITAAETGHLCFATLHTQDAPSTVDRIIDVFPASQQPEVRLRLSMVLAAVISQTLLPRLGGGRACAREVMIVNSAIASLIREGKTHQISSAIEAGAKFGMISIDQYLAVLVKQRLIALEDALAAGRDPMGLKTLLGMGQAPA